MSHFTQKTRNQRLGNLHSFIPHFIFCILFLHILLQPQVNYQSSFRIFYNLYQASSIGKLGVVHLIKTTYTYKYYICFHRVIEYGKASLLCHSYAIHMSLVCTRISCVCHSYVLVCHSYVTVCTCMSFVCHSYVLVCHHMSLVCTRMSFVCHLYLLVCHSYVTRMFLYVIRMSLVCGFAMNRNEIDKFLLFCFCIVQIVYFECFGSLGFKKFLFFNIGS